MKKAQAASTKTKGILFLLVFWFLLSVVSYHLIVDIRENRFDFYPRWIGSRAVLQGRSPYTEEVTDQIQLGMFGRKLALDEDQQKYAYMPTIAVQLLPFWLLPFPLAVSLWMGLQLILLLCLPLAVWKIIDWQPDLPIFTGLVMVSLILFRYPINAYLIGQFIPFCLAALVLAWWGLSEERPAAAALGLLLALVRPEVVFLPVLFALILSWRVFRCRVINMVVIGLAALWLCTRVLIGAWETDYLAGLFSYSIYSAPVWPPALPGTRLVSSLLVVAVLGWAAWMINVTADFPRTEKAGWLLSVSVIFSLLTLPQTGNYTLILGLFAVWFVIGLPGQRSRFQLLTSAVLSLPWVFHLLPREAAPYEHLAIPLLFAAVLTLKYQHRTAWVSRGSRWDLPRGRETAGADRSRQ